MKKIFILIGLLTAIIVSGCLSTSENASEKETIDYSTPRINSEAGITISVTYLPDIKDATAFYIKVTAHKDYNDDFEKISYLRDSDGKIYKPLSYEGTRGHHAEGILRFQRIESKSFELVIQDVAGVKERVYKW